MMVLEEQDELSLVRSRGDGMHMGVHDDLLPGEVIGHRARGMGMRQVRSGGRTDERDSPASVLRLLGGCSWEIRLLTQSAIGRGRGEGRGVQGRAQTGRGRRGGGGGGGRGNRRPKGDH